MKSQLEELQAKADDEEKRYKATRSKLEVVEVELKETKDALQNKIAHMSEKENKIQEQHNKLLRSKSEFYELKSVNHALELEKECIRKELGLAKT